MKDKNPKKQKLPRTSAATQKDSNITFSFFNYKFIELMNIKIEISKGILSPFSYAWAKDPTSRNVCNPLSLLAIESFEMFGAPIKWQFNDF